VDIIDKCSEFDKVAQDRTVWNKLREKSNVTGRILESLNPEFQSLMERLRDTDAKIREQAAQTKDLVRSSKSLVNRRDYLAGAVNLSAFHERCRYIAANLEKFIKSVDLKHYEFLLDQFDDEQKEQLFGYDPSSELKSDEGDVNDISNVVVTAALKKQAGLSDWWFKMTDPIGDLAHNLTNQRSIAMRALEKRFSISFLKQLKTNSITMVIKAQGFLQTLLRTFKRLATALAKRNVDQYVVAAKDFIARFSKFHDTFVKFYTGNIVPLKNQHDQIMEQKRLQEEEKSRAMEEAAQQKRVQEQAAPSQPISPQQPAPASPQPQPGIGSAKKWPFDFTAQKSSPSVLDQLSQNLGHEDGDEKPFDLIKKKNNAFIVQLEKFASQNNSRDVIVSILRYSAELEDVAPNQSLQLLAIAEGIVEDYKTAGVWDFLKKGPEAKSEVKRETMPEKKEPVVPLL